MNGLWIKRSKSKRKELVKAYKNLFAQYQEKKLSLLCNVFVFLCFCVIIQGQVFVINFLLDIGIGWLTG
jgi:hypothetical protein